MKQIYFFKYLSSKFLVHCMFQIFLILFFKHISLCSCVYSNDHVHVNWDKGHHINSYACQDAWCFFNIDYWIIYVHVHAYLLTYNSVYFCRLTVIPVVFQIFKRFTFSQLLSYYSVSCKQTWTIINFTFDVELFVQA